MKHVLMATLISVCCVAVSTAALSSTDLTPLESLKLSSIFLAFIHPIDQLLRYRSRRIRISTEPGDIVRIHDYALPVHVIYVYASSIFFVVWSVISMIAGIVAGILGQVTYNQVGSFGVAMFFVVIFVIILAYMIGRWIGSRIGSSSINALAVGIATVVTVSLLDTILLFVLPEESVQRFGSFMPERSFKWFLYGLLFKSTVYGIAMSLGIWRGRVMRIRNYLYFLLKKLPRNTQQNLVELAYEETKNQADKAIS